MSDSATCVATRILGRTRVDRIPVPDAVRIEELSAVAMRMREARHAGAIPKNAPVKRETPKVNARIRRSGLGLRAELFEPSTKKFTRKRVPRNARTKPATPPSKERINASV